MTDIATIDQRIKVQAPAADNRTIEEISRQIWDSRVSVVMSDFSRICRDRAKEILSDAMAKIDWPSAVHAVVVDGVAPETMEERLREWFAQVLAEEIAS